MKNEHVQYRLEYAKLFNGRQKGDYGDMFDFSEEDVQPLSEPVKDFLAVVQQQIQSAEKK